MPDRSSEPLQACIEQALNRWVQDKLQAMIQQIRGLREHLATLGVPSPRLSTLEAQLVRLARATVPDKQAVPRSVLREAVIDALRQAGAEVSLAELRALVRAKLGDHIDALPPRWLSDLLWRLAVVGEIVYVRRGVYRLAERHKCPPKPASGAELAWAVRQALARRKGREVNLLRLRRELGADEKAFLGAISELVAAGELRITTTSADGVPWYGRISGKSTGEGKPHACESRSVPAVRRAGVDPGAVRGASPQA